jgi:hypothetical protein
MRMLVVSESYQNYHNNTVSYKLTYVRRGWGGDCVGGDPGGQKIVNSLKVTVDYLQYR